jgi:hypothetical protein
VIQVTDDLYGLLSYSTETYTKYTRYEPFLNVKWIQSQAH